MTWTPLYVWHHRYLYEIKLILYDITILYSWCHIDSIHDSTPTLYDITYSILVTSQLQYLWQDSSYVYDIILSIFDISHGVWMTIQPQYPTSHSQYLCNHTHLIDITPYVCLKSHPVHVGQHRHYLNITSSPDDIIPLLACHGAHYVYDIICTIYDVTHTVCMTTQALYLTWNTFYLPSHLLYISSHPLCRRHHTNNVRDHRWHMHAIMCTINDTISTL